MIKSKEILRGAAGLAALGLAGSTQPSSQGFVPERIDDIAIYSLCTPEFGDFREDGARLAEAVRRAHGVVGIGITETYADGETVGFGTPGIAHYTIQALPKGEEFVRADIGATVLCNSFDFGNARGRLSGDDRRFLDEVQSLMPEEEVGGTPI
jgi:hypothetical protein